MVVPLSKDTDEHSNNELAIYDDILTDFLSSLYSVATERPSQPALVNLGPPSTTTVLAALFFSTS